MTCFFKSLIVVFVVALRLGPVSVVSSSLSYHSQQKQQQCHHVPWMSILKVRGGDESEEKKTKDVNGYFSSIWGRKHDQENENDADGAKIKKSNNEANGAKTGFMSIFGLNAQAKEEASLSSASSTTTTTISANEQSRQPFFAFGRRRQQQEDKRQRDLVATKAGIQKGHRGGALAVAKLSRREKRRLAREAAQRVQEQIQQSPQQTDSPLQQQNAKGLFWWSDLWKEHYDAEDSDSKNTAQATTTSNKQNKDKNSSKTTGKLSSSQLAKSKRVQQRAQLQNTDQDQPDDNNDERVILIQDVLKDVVLEDAKKKKKHKRSKKTKEITNEEPQEQPNIENQLQQKEEQEQEKQEEKDTQSTNSERSTEFTSSGHWRTIDTVATLGLASLYPELKLSKHLRPIRKATARVTGLHGILSGKRSLLQKDEDDKLDEEDLGKIRRRIAAIDRARESVERREAEIAMSQRKHRRRRGLFQRRDALRPPTVDQTESDIEEEDSVALARRLEEEMEEQRRKERVKEIDRLILESQEKLLELACEKDALQRRPNPLYNYTETADTKEPNKTVYNREFNFPDDSLVSEYLSELFSTGRLVHLNHTDLWKSTCDLDDDDDDEIGDDLFTPSGDASELYKGDESNKRRPGSSSGASSGGGSWLLRRTFGQGPSLGEKIGETIEAAAYQSICAAVMGSLARTIGSFHGLNVMTHSDVRVFIEHAPDLPHIGKKNFIPGSTRENNYAEDAIKGAMREGIKKRRKKGRAKVSEEAFLQRDAVVETLISHCQISAPLLKLFPIRWQRALLGNIITMIGAIVSDFCQGIEFQILGHAMTFAFNPITESDMIRHIGMSDGGFNHRRARPQEFEAAVRATAEDVSQSLQFMDRWFQKALGSGMLRAQLANLIARIVLTLADEVLSGARMDLWSTQGGPRILLGLEYRTSPADKA